MTTETLSKHTVLMLKRVTEEEVLYGARMEKALEGAMEMARTNELRISVA
jgi:hypothetical protein